MSLSPTAAQADSWSLLVLALGAVAMLVVVVMEHPRAAVALWLGVVALAPVWLGASVGFYLMPAVAAALLALPALLPRRPLPGSAMDLLMVAGFAACLLPLAVGRADAASTFALVTEVALGYALGRLAYAAVGPRWLFGAVTVVFAIVAVGTLAEFLSGTNPFVALARPGSQYADWGPLQERGGAVRAELSFGHSIALGCSLALAIPMILASGARTLLKVGLVVVVLLATAVTFSRIAVACAFLAVALSVLSQRTGMSGRLRGALVTVGVLAAATIAPFLLRVFDAAGDEAVNSAAYRYDLWRLVSSMSPLGLSDAAWRTADGTLRFGQFRSIDSQVIYFGLKYGWLPLVLMGLALVAGFAVVAWQRARPATIAVVAQTPALVSVALITQYQILFWFVAGVAVASQAQRTVAAPGASPLRPKIRAPLVGSVARPDEQRT